MLGIEDDIEKIEHDEIKRKRAKKDRKAVQETIDDDENEYDFADFDDDEDEDF